MKEDIKRKIIDCGESGTTARLTMIPVAQGVAGEGIFVFTGKGRLPKRPHKYLVDIINREAIKKLTLGKSFFNYLSIAVPSNKDYHMPITIYVGDSAMKE